MEALESALYLAQIAIQRAAAKSSTPPIWYVTHGTQSGTIRTYMHSGLWGLARTFRMEERGVELRCLDLDGSLSTSDALASDLKHWLTVLKGTEAESEVAVTSTEGSAEASVSRLSRSKAMPLKSTELLMSSRGSLSNLRHAAHQAAKGCSSRIASRAPLVAEACEPRDAASTGSDRSGAGWGSAGRCFRLIVQTSSVQVWDLTSSDRCKCRQLLCGPNLQLPEGAARPCSGPELPRCAECHGCLGSPKYLDHGK